MKTYCCFFVWMILFAPNVYTEVNSKFGRFQDLAFLPLNPSRPNFEFTSVYADLGGEFDLPRCIIIGAQKSGTGAFYEILRQHPEVVDRPGEVHFFDINFDKGVEWYKDEFPHSDFPKVIRIDKSPYYLFHPLAAERAYSIVPRAKLIVLLRNPIDRAYSQYQMNVRYKDESLSFEDAIEAESERLARDTGDSPETSNHRRCSYLSRGVYIDQLKKWLEFYPAEQMMIISWEDFLQNPAKIIQETVMFIGLSEYDKFKFNIGKKHRYSRMEPSLRQELSDYFRPYNEELEALLNRRFNWD